MTSQCSCCGFEGIPVEPYPTKQDPQNELCGLCASSMAGVSHEYWYDDLRVLQTICYVGNAILQTIRGPKS